MKRGRLFAEKLADVALTAHLYFSVMLAGAREGFCLTEKDVRAPPSRLSLYAKHCAGNALIMRAPSEVPCTACS